MGFARSSITLKWSPDHELHGFEVVMRRRSLREELADITADDDEFAGRSLEQLSIEERAALSARKAGQFAALILSWNLEAEDGAPIVLPERAPGESEIDWVRQRGEILMQHCDGDMINDMRLAYLTGVARVSPPLPEKSEPGSGTDSTKSDEPHEPMPEDWSMPAAEALDPSLV